MMKREKPFNGSTAEIIEQKLQKAAFRYQLRRLVRDLAITAAVTYVIFGLLFGISIVSGSSMEAQFTTGTLVFYFRPDKNPSAGEVIVFKSHGSERQLTKRVVAAEGDRVEIDASGSTVRVNKSTLYTTREGDTLPDEIVYTEEIILSAGEFFVLGDNMKVSADSREFGPVLRSEISGTVIFSFNGFAK